MVVAAWNTVPKALPKIWKANASHLWGMSEVKMMYPRAAVSPTSKMMMRVQTKMRREMVIRARLACCRSYGVYNSQ